MKPAELAKALGYTILTTCDAAKEIKGGYTSDLLSDVMGNASEESILITIQAHKNTIAVASLKDFPAIVICNDRAIPEDMIKTADEEGIVLMCTKDNQFEASVKIADLLGISPSSG